MNKRLMTDIADANGLQKALRPTGFFNIKKMAADFCSAQCIMDNTGSLMKDHFIDLCMMIMSVGSYLKANMGMFSTQVNR